ncbi:hypothetical protein [Streptomyces sp. NPDC058657]|uniref:hypothetical protein n=1 Tax=unclassified Streptomyces TaxID=2593676 RepID=UPI0036589CAB
MIGTRAALRVAVGAVACGAVTVLAGLGALLHWWSDPDFARESARAVPCRPGMGSASMNGSCVNTDPWRVLRVHRGEGPRGSGAWLDIRPADDFASGCESCDNTERVPFAGRSPLLTSLRPGDTVQASGLGFTGTLRIERDGVTQTSLNDLSGVADARLARALTVLAAGAVLLASGGCALRVAPVPRPSPRPA